MVSRCKPLLLFWWIIIPLFWSIPIFWILISSSVRAFVSWWTIFISWFCICVGGIAIVILLFFFNRFTIAIFISSWLFGSFIWACGPLRIFRSIVLRL